MALFANLEIEDRLQINDKTRLKGSKSFYVGANAITDITVMPGADGLAISVFNTDSEKWYLDWEFKTWSGDFDTTNNKLDFDEGGSELTATITPGTYDLAALAAEVQAQMIASGADAYTVSADKDDKITIASDGNFNLYPTEGSNSNESILPILGFNSIGGRGDNAFTNETSVKGKRVRSLPKAITITAINGVDPDDIKTQYIKVFSVEGDGLFSTDNDLAGQKSDIQRWVEDGRNTFKKQHRNAQDEIMEYMRGEGYIDVYGEPLDVSAMLIPSDLNEWSKYMVMRIIMDDISNSIDDIFDREARKFEGREMRTRSDALIRADLDRDGKADIREGVSVRSARLIRL